MSKNKGYYDSLTIYEVISQIDKREFLLPSFQRKFVWKPEQILLLFDSIMQGYPISTFMFWNIREPSIRNNTYYEMNKTITKDDDSQTPHNPNPHDFKAIIDGQQRLTALYVGLKGSYDGKKLYLNLTKHKDMKDPKNNNQMKFNFAFFSEKDFEKKANDGYWYEVEQILSQTDQVEYMDYIRNLEKNNYDEATIYRTLDILKSKIHNEYVINFYQEENQDLDYILTTFTRVNDGGRRLEKSDLLFSFLTSKLDNNFRENIENLLKLTNINISKDFVLKCVLAIAEIPVNFSVSNFTNLDKDKFNTVWKKTSQAIANTLQLLRNMGYTNPQAGDRLMLSENLVIPIIYYIYNKKIGSKCLSDIILKEPHKKDIPHIEKEKATINKWLLLASMKKIFGNSTDNRLTKIRDVIRESLNKKEKNFPLEAIMLKLGTSAEEKDINLVIDSVRYGDSSAVAILALLQKSSFTRTEPLELDHLHPKASFTDEENKTSDKDSIANLALIPYSWNREKSDKPLEQWVQDKDINVEDFLIEKNTSLHLDNFLQFIEQRKTTLKNKLKEILEIT